MRERRQRDGSFVDVGDLRRALAVYAVDRPVKIRLPDGSEFAVGAVRRDRDFEPLEDAPVLLIAANVDKQEKKTMKLEEIIPGLRAGKTAWKRGGYCPPDADRDYYRLGARTHSGIERVTEYLNPATGRRSEYVRYHRLTRRDFERDDWEFGRFERSPEARR